MDIAIQEALKSLKYDEVPVGAIVVDKDNNIIGRGHNSVIKDSDATCHAEINAIREATQNQNTWRLDGFRIFTTIEPCIMCMGCILNSRLSEVIFGAEGDRQGSITKILSSHELFSIKVTRGILGTTCSKLMKDFFKKKRG
ncbi:MAG: nucleoside deaminase [Chlamydiia bacterium]|nr:nucleoside deaminase [Chlamydiia bacterium]